MTIIDTHTLFTELVTNGMAKKQAQDIINNFATKAHLEELKEILVTKSDLKVAIAEIKGELKSDIAEVKADLRIGIAEVRAELRGDIDKVKTNLIQWMVGLTISSTGLTLGLIIHFLGK